MAAAELDLNQISSFCSLPHSSITTLLDAPTTDLVQSLLRNIASKAQEHGELTSKKLKLGVELENAVRGGETKTRILKSSVEKALKEAADLRQRLEDEGTYSSKNARVSVEAELENLKASTAESSQELSTQKARTNSLESSNRDTLSLLESKTTAYDELAEELNAQHQKTIDVRREVSVLEQSVQSANAAAANAQFHEHGLLQEIESLKRTNDWLDKELKTKSGEYTKYRKEKSLRIAELQRQYDEAQSSLDAGSRMETNLRRRLEEISQKADDSFSKIQQLQEEHAKKEEAFCIELDAANRLSELTRNSADTERQRQQDLFAQLENAKEDASEQIGRLGAELETEHREREAADTKVAELEVQVEQLQTSLTASQSRPPTNGVHHRGINGHVTPSQGTGTPIGSPGTPRPKGGLSITQMYSSYNDLKADVEFEKRRNEKLSSTLDEMVQDLEMRQPEIEELRVDHTRLESDIAEMSSLVDIIGKERDQAVKGARKWEGQMEAKIREGEVLRQQLRDLSSQVKVFLMETHLRNQGHDDVSADARAQLERLAQGQINGESIEHTTDTDRFISENLVAFRNIGELQEQNSNLLKITREIGEKMEHEEATRKHLEQTRNWDDLQQKYGQCKDEIKSLVTQSQSYIRERDMFRRMLAQRGQTPINTDAKSLFDESVSGEIVPGRNSQGVMTESTEDPPLAKDLADYARLYKDMQAHFDAYRNESATDRSTLKEQVDTLSRMNSELRSEFVRVNSQVTLAHERYEMLQANYAMLRNENLELQKRSHLLSEGATKQELRVQQVAEDLVEARGLVDSMRNENASLKAGKDFWKTVEKRLTEDNDNLLNERNRLNSLNTNLQNLLNERDRSDSETRRRLQTHVDSLERDLQIVKKKLDEETEDTKRAVQRREFDNEQSQKRIDDLVSSLGTIREQLVAANTTKDHLCIKVDELTIELRSADERINVLQAASAAPAARPHANDTELQDSSHNDNGLSLSKEQQLAVEISELRRDLDLAKAELENVKSQVEQYKAISQASEDELQSLNDTQDLYRQETDRLVEEKDLKVKELEQRLEDTTSELASTNSELSELRNEQAENHRRLEDHKKAFEAELSQLKDQDDRHAAAAQYYQEDLKAQACIAQQAHQNYENELVKHADAAKALQKLRIEYNKLKLEAAEVRTEAESARTSLAQNEENWAELRDRYEGELGELKAGRENLTAQNNRLHQQLEAVTAQISGLRKRAASDDVEVSQEQPQAGLDNLQEVIKYLRREKEIVDVQLELSTQEGKRLKQQFDYAQSQLDDTRLRLNQQRRVQDDTERSNLDHNRLVETISELNTFRESNVTLRAEGRQAQAALATRNTEYEELKAKIEPLQTEILELKNERETQEGEMKLLRENSDRWQQRAQNVLQKYDRVDPAELEALKEQLKTLEAERNELQTARQSLQELVDNSSAQISQVQDQSNEKLETMRSRLTDQFKARSKTQSDRIKEKDAALQTAINEKQLLEQRLSELSGLQAEVNAARAERDAAIEKSGIQAAAPHQSMHVESEDGQLDEAETLRPTNADLKFLNEKASDAEARAQEQSFQSDSLRSQLDLSNSHIAELNSQIKKSQENMDKMNEELIHLRSSRQDFSNPSNHEVEQDAAKLREDLLRAQQDVENLRAAASVSASLAKIPAEDGSKSVAEHVAEHVEAVRAELEARHQERLKEADETVEKRTNNMRNQLSKKLAEGKAQIRQSLVSEHEKAIQQLKTDHSQEIIALEARHRDELDELKRNEDARFTELQEAAAAEKSKEDSDRSSTIKAEGETDRGPWQPSETEAKAFMQSNELARSIVKKTINSHVTKAKDELTAQLKEEHEKSMIESQNKANTAKDHAVMMEGKKTAVQVNMANNKARISQYKIGIVEKAAQETPQKPVGEVWSIVKDAKPPPTTVPQPQVGPSKTQQSPAAASFGQLAPPTQTAHQKPVPMPFAQSTPFSQGVATQQHQQAQLDQAGQEPRVPTFGPPSPAVITTQTSLSDEQRSSTGQQPAQTSSGSANQTNPPPHDQGPLAPQQRPPQNTANIHSNAGTGPSALRGLQQSGLPVARGGSLRGNATARGGVGRGGPQGINTNQSQQQGRNSPTRGGMNPGAKQFVPGNKRPRDDGQHGGDGGNGKRIRGGGGGS